MAYNALTMVLGGVLVDGDFRDAMTEDIDEALETYGITLTGPQREAAGRMMESLGSGILDEPINTVGSECPNWPCPGFKLSAG